MSKYKINDIENLESTLINLVRDIYVNHTKEEKRLVNKKVFLSARVCRYLGLPYTDSGKEYPIKRVLKAYGGFPLDDNLLIDYVLDKLGDVKTKYEVSQDKKVSLNLEYNKLLDDFDDDFIDFLNVKFTNKRRVVNNSNLIRKLYRTYDPPEGITLLSAFALERVGDTHGLDSGKKLRSWFNDLLIYKYGDKDLNSHNISIGESNYIVTSYNVVENTSKRQENIGIIDIDRLSYVTGKDIHIIENNGVADDLFKKDPSVRIVIGSGFINLATKKLIEKLLDNNNKLYYSGDLDYAGLRIADGLLKEFPEVKLEYMDTLTYQKYKEHAIKPSKDQLQTALYDDQLSELQEAIIKNNGYFIYQESIWLE